jgi:hypothetical protein
MVPASVQAVVGINQAERKRVGDWWLSGRHENADAERQTLPQINIEIVWSKAEYETLRVRLYQVYQQRGHEPRAPAFMQREGGSNEWIQNMPDDAKLGGVSF